MFPCPHCGKPIEVGPLPKGSWRQFDPGGTRASLGCGTLILIAIIVAIFSRWGSDTETLREVQQQIQQLEEKIDRLDRP
jgi:hypothetical protein